MTVHYKVKNTQKEAVAAYLKILFLQMSGAAEVNHEKAVRLTCSHTIRSAIRSSTTSVKERQNSVTFTDVHVIRL
jgi:hypothetical protein